MCPSDTYPDEDAYERVGGVFVLHRAGHDAHGQVGRRDPHAHDDYVEDPLDDEHVPGTIDDLPLDYGLELAPAADQVMLSIEHGPIAGFGDLGQTERVES